MVRRGNLVLAIVFIASIFVLLFLFNGFIFTGKVVGDFNSRLITHFKFENNLVDSSGNGWNATCTSCPSYVNGKDAKAIKLDGKSNALNLNYIPSVKVNGTYSIALWFNAESSENDAALIDFSNDGKNRNGINIVGSKIGGGYYGGSYNGRSSPFNKNVWNHAVLTNNLGVVKFYLNGVEINGGSFTWLGAYTSKIGYNANAGYFNGSLDDVRVYDRTLNNNDVLALYESFNNQSNTSNNSTNSSIGNYTNEYYVRTINWSGSLGFNYTQSPIIKIEPTNRYGFLFRVSDSIKIYSLKPICNSTLRIFDIYGKTIKNGAGNLSLETGHYFVECNNDRATFAVVPNDYNGSSFFGIDAIGSGSDPVLFDGFKSRWRRAFGNDHWWATINPSQGVWNWTNSDLAIQKNMQNGNKVLFTAWYRPSWVTDANFIQNYNEFVKRVALRYNGNTTSYGKVDAIEIWNEANCKPEWDVAFKIVGCNNQSGVPVAYLNLLKNATFSIRSVNQNVEIVGAGWASPTTHDVINGFANLNGGSYLNAFTFHAYERGTAPADENLTIYYQFQDPEIYWRIDSQVDIYKNLYPGEKLYMNEGGLYGKSALDIPNNATTYLALSKGLNWSIGKTRAIKYVVMYRAAGVEMIIPHVLTSYSRDLKDNFEVFGIEFDGRGVSPKTSAFLMSIYWLNNANFVGKRVFDDNLLLYGWNKTGESMVFGWTIENKFKNIIDKNELIGINITDIYGKKNDLSVLQEEPVIFKSKTLSTIALLDKVEKSLRGSCGNSIIDSVNGEQCDSNNLDSQTCSSLGFNAGSLSCTSTCNFNVNYCYSFPNDFVSRWTFDADVGNKAIDKSGKNNGAYVRALNLSSGCVYGKCVKVNQTAYIEILNAQNLNLPDQGEFTLSFWFKTRTYTSNNYKDLIRKGLDVNPVSKWGIRPYNNKIYLSVANKTASAEFATWGVDIVNDTWTHATFVYSRIGNNATVKTYQNGILKGSRTLPVSWYTSTNTGSLKFGTIYNQDIYLDDVRIYNRSLSINEIKVISNQSYLGF